MKEGRRHQSIHFLDSSSAVGLRKQRLFSKQVLGNRKKRADTALKIQGAAHCLTRDVSAAARAVSTRIYPLLSYSKPME